MKWSRQDARKRVPPFNFLPTRPVIVAALRSNRNWRRPELRIASSLTRDFSFFVAAVLRVVPFRGEVAFLAAGFAAFPLSVVPLGDAFSLSLTFAFFGMV